MNPSPFNIAPQDIPVTVRWLNPIGCPTFDEPIAHLLHSIKLPSTQVEVVSFDMPHSPSHLEYRAYEALTHERTVHIARDSARAGVDALVIGCFYDPTLEDAREISGPALHASHGFCDFERGHHWVNHWHSDFSLYLLEKAEFDGAAEDDGFGTVILHGAMGLLDDPATGDGMVQLKLVHAHAQRP